MATTIQDTLKQVGYGAARTLIAAAGGFMVTEGWIAASKSVAVEDAMLGVVGVVGILAWSAGEKLWTYVKQELAKIPPTSLEGQVLAAFEAAAPAAEPAVQAAIVAEAEKLNIPLAPAPVLDDPGVAEADPQPPAGFRPPIFAGHPLV